MRKISAKYIYTGKTVLKNGIVEVADDGSIVKVTDTGGKVTESASLEYYNGVVVPGFINAHCHLELSHMKGAINNQSGRGLPGFIDEIISKRSFPDDLQERIHRADKEMQLNGIVAVGDISNTDDSFKIKKGSSLYYHTFIETFTFDNASSAASFEKAAANYQLLQTYGLQGSIVPHSSYTVPDALYDRIQNNGSGDAMVVSIHNQETPSEDEFVTRQSGALAEVLIKKGFRFSDFTFKANNSIESSLMRQNKNDNILLIHNTFSREEHIDFAENFSDHIYWVFCPLSNLYIEKTVPDLPLFFRKGVKTCIGTDSYASNNELNVLSELKTIASRFTEIPFEKLVETACINGAKALKIENRYGSIEPGKKPGINLIEGFDFERMNLNESSKLKVLV